MLIFTTINESIYTYSFVDGKGKKKGTEQYTLLNLEEIENKLKKGTSYILYENSDQVNNIGNPKYTKENEKEANEKIALEQKEVITNTKTKVLKKIVLKDIFQPIFDGLKNFSKETCNTYNWEISKILKLTNTTHIIGIEVNRFSSNNFYFSLTLKNINDIKAGILTEKSNEYIKIKTDYDNEIEINTQEMYRYSTTPSLIPQIIKKKDELDKEYNSAIKIMKERGIISQEHIL